MRFEEPTITSFGLSDGLIGAVFLEETKFDREGFLYRHN